MTKNKILYISVVTIALLSSCKNEEPFSVDIPQGSGRVLTSAFHVEVNAETISTRTQNVPELSDLTVNICKETDLDNPIRSYSYDEMPEVITLPVGNYKVSAVYGDGEVVSDFDSPYYYGDTSISIENGKILEEVNPIYCKLSNVKVSVSFDKDLLEVMGDDGQVSVRVGESGELIFTPETTSDGFFKYVVNSHTLAANFSGTVYGAHISENKTYDNVNPGYYYKITFKLKNSETGAEDPGNITTGDPSNLLIDATVTYHNNASEDGINVNPDTVEYLEDDLRPGADYVEPDPGEEEPNKPGEGETPSEGLAQLVSSDVNLNEVTDISHWNDGRDDDDLRPLAVQILTPTKLKKFTCTIKSTFLTPQELRSAGLDVGDDGVLDLINDTHLFEALSELGFPVGEQVTNPQKFEDGNYVIDFDITTFVPMLNITPDNTHDFIFTLENEAGEVVHILKLKN